MPPVIHRQVGRERQGFNSFDFDGLIGLFQPRHPKEEQPHFAHYRFFPVTLLLRCGHAALLYYYHPFTLETDMLKVLFHQDWHRRTSACQVREVEMPCPIPLPMPKLFVPMEEQRTLAAISAAPDQATQFALFRYYLERKIDQMERFELQRVEFIKDCLLLASQNMQDARLQLIEDRLSALENPKGASMGWLLTVFVIELVIVFAVECVFVVAIPKPSKQRPTYWLSRKPIGRPVWPVSVTN